MSDIYDEKAAAALAALSEVHWGWCNYCCGRADTCNFTEGKSYECSLVTSRKAVAAALRLEGESADSMKRTWNAACAYIAGLEAAKEVIVDVHYPESVNAIQQLIDAKKGEHHD